MLISYTLVCLECILLICIRPVIKKIGLQLNVIRTDVFIMPVFHTKTIWDNTQLREAYSFVKMSCVDISFNNSVELQYAKTDVFRFLNAVLDKFLADMLSTASR